VTNTFRSAHLHRINRSPVPFAEFSAGAGVLLFDPGVICLAMSTGRTWRPPYGLATLRAWC
jgi:hypothetical protein